MLWDASAINGFAIEASDGRSERLATFSLRAWVGLIDG